MASKSGAPRQDRWPSVAWEQRPWEAVPDRGESHRARLRARGPYDAAVPPLIADRALPPLSPETVVAGEDAVTELVRFDGEYGATTAPFAAILLRSESASSSEIERLTAQMLDVATEAALNFGQKRPKLGQFLLVHHGRDCHFPAGLEGATRISESLV